MEENKLKELHNLLFEFIPLYHQKFGPLFHKDNIEEPKCNKNQVKSMFIINKWGKMTPTELGKCLELRKGSLTTLMDSLEEMRLVCREPDALDRRKIWLSLTPEGERYLARKRQAHEQNFRELFKSLSDAEIMGFGDSLKQIISLMKKL